MILTYLPVWLACGRAGGCGGFPFPSLRFSAGSAGEVTSVRCVCVCACVMAVSVCLHEFDTNPSSVGGSAPRVEGVDSHDGVVTILITSWAGKRGLVLFILFWFGCLVCYLPLTRHCMNFYPMRFLLPGRAGIVLFLAPTCHVCCLWGWPGSMCVSLPACLSETPSVWCYGVVGVCV